MLSKTSSTLLRFICKWTSFFGGMPFEWDSRRSKLAATPRSWAKWIVYLVYYIHYVLYSCGKILHLLLYKKIERIRHRKDEDWKEYAEDPYFVAYTKIKGFQMLIAFVIAGLLAYNTSKHLKEIVIFINSFIRYSQHFRNAFTYSRRLGGLGRNHKNGCEPILKTIILLMVILPVLMAVAYGSNPKDDRFLTSLLPDPSAHRPRLRGIIYALYVIYGLSHLWCVLAALSSVFFYISVCILVSSVTFQMLREIQGGHQCYKTRPLLRRPPRLSQVYRSLQLQTLLMNQALTSCNFPLKYCAQQMAGLSACLQIKFHRMENALSRTLLLLGPQAYLWLWLLLLHLYGQLWSKSRGTVGSWDYLRLKVYAEFVFLRKFRKSATPLKVKIGNAYFVKPNRVLVTINAVFRSTLKMLLSVQKRIK